MAHDRAKWTRALRSFGLGRVWIQNLQALSKRCTHRARWRRQKRGLLAPFVFPLCAHSPWDLRADCGKAAFHTSLMGLGFLIVYRRRRTTVRATPPRPHYPSRVGFRN